MPHRSFDQYRLEEVECQERAGEPSVSQRIYLLGRENSWVATDISVVYGNSSSVVTICLVH